MCVELANGAITEPCVDHVVVRIRGNPVCRPAWNRENADARRLGVGVQSGKVTPVCGPDDAVTVSKSSIGITATTWRGVYRPYDLAGFGVYVVEQRTPRAPNPDVVVLVEC